MTHVDINAGMSPVTPIDLEAGIAAAWQPEPEELVLLVDPTTRRLVGRPIPRSLADELIAVFKRIEAQGRAAPPAPDYAAALADFRDLVWAASAIGGDMRALTYLFRPAVCDDGGDTPLTAASHLVIDCIDTMAARLVALETKAAAISAPFVGRAVA